MKKNKAPKFGVLRPSFSTQHPKFIQWVLDNRVINDPEIIKLKNEIYEKIDKTNNYSERQSLLDTLNNRRDEKFREIIGSHDRLNKEFKLWKALNKLNEAK